MIGLMNKDLGKEALSTSALALGIVKLLVAYRIFHVPHYPG